VPHRQLAGPGEPGRGCPRSVPRWWSRRGPPPCLTTGPWLLSGRARAWPRWHCADSPSNLIGCLIGVIISSVGELENPSRASLQVQAVGAASSGPVQRPPLHGAHPVDARTIDLIYPRRLLPQRAARGPDEPRTMSRVSSRMCSGDSPLAAPPRRGGGEPRRHPSDGSAGAPVVRGGSTWPARSMSSKPTTLRVVGDAQASSRAARIAPIAMASLMARTGRRGGCPWPTHAGRRTSRRRWRSGRRRCDRGQVDPAASNAAR
jgi:hypothetical protein